MYLADLYPSAYQLFITLGILLASLINFGTSSRWTDDPRSWRVTMGIALVWPVIMAVGIQFLPESPRWEYRQGHQEEARATIAQIYGVSVNHQQVVDEIREIRQMHEEELAGGAGHWFDVFTAPTMFKRILIGVVLQMGQQLTGANYFFYYGTTLFSAAGVGNSFITAIVLGVVNFVVTVFGVLMVDKFGRRRLLILGGIWIAVCLLVFASVGHFYLDEINLQKGGQIMVAFSCLALVGFATTWGPLPWVVCAEIYPLQYRATAMALATASNWSWNFMIGFFTPFITKAIGYSYGYVFAGATFVSAAFVVAMLPETSGKSLEMIDQMILSRVKPWKSAKWDQNNSEA